MKQRTAERAYITAADVEYLMGIKQAKAYDIIREVNSYAVEKGYMAFPQGKANKYLFAEKFGIPQDVVNAATKK